MSMSKIQTNKLSGGAGMLNFVNQGNLNVNPKKDSKKKNMNKFWKQTFEIWNNFVESNYKTVDLCVKSNTRSPGISALGAGSFIHVVILEGGNC
ncbi:hypothetical protein BB558_007469 [Smittium angustum]|uniref:Uncharacterized protein n=1 Tax=Smittium angustum TaxID=133377 RepID=A0A2U1IUY6_SMIAN|nr:hypothetical protein BB558_007469 [Smittium angustum]